MVELSNHREAVIYYKAVQSRGAWRVNYISSDIDIFAATLANWFDGFCTNLDD